MYKNIKSNVKDFIGDVKEYADTVLHGRDDVPPKVRQIVKQFKDVPIVGITINRTPVNPMIIKALNLVSQGHFGSKLEDSPYDKLFHLSIFCKLQNGKTVKLEKNEVVNADVNPSVSKDADLEVVGNLKQGLTLKGLLQGGEQFMGNDFLPYNAVHNNCQDFIMGLFKGSNIGDASDFKFIKQDTKEFFKGKDQKYVRRIAKYVTDLGGKVNEIIYGHGMTGGLLNRNKIKSIGHTLLHPQHTFHEVGEAVKDAGKSTGSILNNVFTGKVDSLKDSTKIKGMHHLTDNLSDDEEDEPLSTKSKKTKNISKRLKGLKNKISKIGNMSKSDKDHEGDYSSSDEEELGVGHDEESDIMHRMAKLSHDIHRHHKDHGLKKRILKGYHLFGDGLKHSMNQPRIQGTGPIKKFNAWFKAIGQKFKTLNHNLKPIKQAGTDYAVNYINPLSAAENYLNDFQREAPETGDALRSLFKGSKQETKPVTQPYQPYQPYTYDYSGYSLPDIPVASPFKDTDDVYIPNMYGNGFGCNIIKTSKSVGKDLINAGGDRAVRAIEGSGRGRYYEYDEGTGEYELVPPSGARRIANRRVGSNIIKTSKSVGKDLINAGGDRAVRAIEGSGGKNHHYMRSAAQTALMLGNPASVHGRNIKLTAKHVGKDLIEAGGERAVRAIEGSGKKNNHYMRSAAQLALGMANPATLHGRNITLTAKHVGKDVINAGGERAVRAIEGSGTKRGRLVKGSPEAKEWARKMREAKLSKR